MSCNKDVLFYDYELPAVFFKLITGKNFNSLGPGILAPLHHTVLLQCSSWCIKFVKMKLKLQFDSVLAEKDEKITINVRWLKKREYSALHNTAAQLFILHTRS